MKLRLAALLCALAAPSGLEAQDIQLQLDQTLVENFDGTAVPDAFGAFKAEVAKKATDDGAPFYDVIFPGGLSGRAIPARCKDDKAHTGCTGLRIVAYYQLPEGKTVADIATLANGFNAGHEATQVVYDQTGKSRLTYYVVSDFGITRTNLVVQLYTFRQTAQAWSQTLFGAPPAAAAAPAPQN